jgi:hypothetical protein
VYVRPAVVLAALALAACTSAVQGAGTGAGPRDQSAATATGASTPASSAAGGTHPVPSTPVRTVQVSGAHGDYAVQVWAETEVHDCAVHAYGAVIAFLRAHPCNGLKQLLATTTVDGRKVGLASRSIGFRGTGDSAYRTAGAFRSLVTKSGTGNLNDLLREGYRLPGGPTSVPFPNAFDAQSQDAGVTVVEAWYIDGHTPDNDPPLVHMAQDLFLQGV